MKLSSLFYGILLLCYTAHVFGFSRLWHFHTNKFIVRNVNQCPHKSSQGTGAIPMRFSHLLKAASGECPISGDAPKSTASIDKLTNKVNLLVDLWKSVAFPIAINEDTDTEFKLSDYNMSRAEVNGLLKHFQACKDCAGDTAFLMAGASDEDGSDALKLMNVEFQLLTEESNDDHWGKFDKALLGNTTQQSTRSTIFPVEADDNIILKDSKKWVEKMIADFAICPFTTDPNRAGIPMGGVRYSISRATAADEAFLRYWEEVQLVLQTDERTMATVLLVFPELNLFGNYELFEAYCESLQDALTQSSVGLESQIQLVFFHPKFQFRDGQARTTEDSAAPNFARRAPWPMINILRTPQVRTAQRGVPTGVVYKQNEEHLNEVGTATLERMLYERNWEGLPVHSSSVKSHRKASDESKAINLLDPVLTSLSVDKQVYSHCPMSGTAAAEVAAAVPLDQQQQQQQQQELGDFSKSTLEQTAGTPAAAALDSSSKVEEVDYLKLAEEVDEWLAQGGL